ncbi:MAG: hypothetical protein MR911_06805 [Spirochaetia bacterium]|nr:hypothetical protein [Spirochaetia bacterium]
MKKSFFILTVLFFTSYLFSMGSKNQRNFVKGNLIDKTEAVKAASEVEIVDLAKAAIEFSLNYKEILGDDSELSALAISGITALPVEYIENSNMAEKNLISEKLIGLYSVFEDENVKIAVLNKISSFKFSVENFIPLLNDFVKNSSVNEENLVLLKSVVNTLGSIGNNQSFIIMLGALSEKKWEPLFENLEKSLCMLAEPLEKEILDILRRGNVKDCRRLFDLIVKKSENSQIFKAEIAENVLLRTIYIYENSNSTGEDLISLQLESFDFLKKLKWTRASNTIVSYLKTARSEYDQKLLEEDKFCEIITGVSDVAPIGAIQPLATYLIFLNSKMEEKSSDVSENLVLAIIKSLGAIGDKNAFDALLGVTYFEYSDSVIAAARDALAKLKW